MSSGYKTKSDLYAEIQELEMELALTLDDAIRYKKLYEDEVRKHEGTKYKLSEQTKLLRKYREENDIHYQMYSDTWDELKQCVDDYNELRSLFTMKEFGIAEQDPYEIVLDQNSPGEESEDFALDFDEDQCLP